MHSGTRSRRHGVARSPASIRGVREAAGAHGLDVVSSEGGVRRSEDGEGSEKFHFLFFVS